MNWEEWVERIPGTICRIYLAQIKGTHPLYCFARSFCTVEYSYGREEIYCSAELPEYGVFELCVRWYEDSSKELICRHRQWFVVFEGCPYDLDRSEVLFTLFNLHLQEGNDSAA